MRENISQNINTIVWSHTHLWKLILNNYLSRLETPGKLGCLKLSLIQHPKLKVMIFGGFP